MSQRSEVAAARTPLPAHRTLKPFTIAAFFVVHAALGPLVAGSVLPCTMYAWGVSVTALIVAFASPRLDWAVFAAGYVAMCDVIWRTGGAKFPSEGAKYLFSLVLVVAFVRHIHRGRRLALPAIYFALLVPSTLLTLQAHGVIGSREAISFDLSGPFALAVAAAFFLQIRMGWNDFRVIALACLGPIVAVASAATLGTVTTNDLVFNQESLKATSGGFGPNQVSGLLSLGALLCLLLLLRERSIHGRLGLLVVGVWCVGQSALTFSRGGAYNFAVAAGVLLVSQLIAAPGRGRFAFAIVGIVIVGLLVFGQVNAFTGGKLEQRFSDTGTTNRSKIIDSDLRLWEQHPIGGVGPGRAGELRPADIQGEPPHTEYTRLLAEHGLMGAAAIVALLAMAGLALLRAPSAWGRGVSLALSAWALTGMTHAGMRIAAFSFVFGLALARLEPNPRGQAVRSLI